MSTLLRACPVCCGQDLGIYLEGENKSVVSSMVGSSRQNIGVGRVLRCHACRFGFREMWPSDDELVRLYQEMDTQVYDAESYGRSKTAEVHFAMVQRYRRQAGRILDVGCATGLFLQRAMEAGWDVVGVELSGAMCAKARERLGPRADIHCSSLQSVSFAPASFDAISLWDVLEHVRDPVLFLKTCASFLKPDGYLFANVPNLDSLPSRVLGSRWPLLLPEHLSYFNPGALRICGEKAGLQQVAFIRRPAVFSVDYVLYRLGQHRIPGVALARTLIRRMGLATRSVPLYLGEICGVWGLRSQ